MQIYVLHMTNVNCYIIVLKVESKHVCIIDATVTYDQPETGHFFLLNQ